MDTAGAVWVYTRTGDGWNRARAVLAAPPNGERLGHEIDSDGERIVAAGLSGEYVEVLTPDGPGWERDIFHIGGPAVFWGHGDVAVDGDIVVAGFAQDEVAHVLRWTGTRWERDLLNGGASTHFFGDTVQVEGNRIVVGASGHTPGPGGPSSIHVFERLDGTWESTTVTAAEREGFATNISLSGNTIVAGRWSGWEEGVWYIMPKVFHRHNGSWHGRDLDFPEPVNDDTWSPIPVVFHGDRGHGPSSLQSRRNGSPLLLRTAPALVAARTASAAEAHRNPLSLSRPVGGTARRRSIGHANPASLAGPDGRPLVTRAGAQKASVPVRYRRPPSIA